MSENQEPPFQSLSNAFIETQRSFNTKVNDLKVRLERLSDKSKSLANQLNADPFSARLNALVNLEEKSKLILFVAKEIEKQREDIVSVLDLLTKTKEVKLNK